MSIEKGHGDTSRYRRVLKMGDFNTSPAYPFLKRKTAALIFIYQNRR